jgi:hypothetical protein
MMSLLSKVLHVKVEYAHSRTVALRRIGDSSSARRTLAVSNNPTYNFAQSDVSIDKTPSDRAAFENLKVLMKNLLQVPKDEIDADTGV